MATDVANIFDVLLIICTFSKHITEIFTFFSLSEVVTLNFPQWLYAIIKLCGCGDSDMHITYSPNRPLLHV